MRTIRLLLVTALATALLAVAAFAREPHPTADRLSTRDRSIESAASAAAAAATTADDTPAPASDDAAGSATSTVSSTVSSTVPAAGSPTATAPTGTAGTPTADDPAPPAPTGPVLDVVPGTGAGSPVAAPDPDAPLGDAAHTPYAPAGIDFQAPPSVPAAPVAGDWGGPGSYSAGPGCMVRCITSGLAYPRGFGAELVVVTDTPAVVWLVVTADTNDDGHVGVGDDVFTATSTTPTQDFRATFDDLDPGRTYWVTAVAEDQDGHTDHRYGDFTTLAERVVTIELGDTHITGGPIDIQGTWLLLGVDDHLSFDPTPGQPLVDAWSGTADTLDLRLLVQRIRGCFVPGAYYEVSGLQGESNDGCLVWNTALGDDIPLDTAPAGATRWTSATSATTVQTTMGGTSLPGDFGGSAWFDATTPVTLQIAYR